MEEQWLAGGLAVVSLILPAGWQWLKNRPGQAIGLKIEQRWLGRTAEFFYFVGLPYLAVILGLLSPRLLGLKGLEQFVLIPAENFSAVSVVAATQEPMMLMLADWLADLGLMIVAGLLALIILAGITVGLTRYGIKQVTAQTSAVDTIYHALHWAFYRAIFWLITGDLYLGIVLGVGMVILEGWIIIWLQKNWRTQQPRRLMDVIILILTSAIFFYRPNLWLLWPIHLAMVALVKNRLVTE